jgi:hypothetical protein
MTKGKGPTGWALVVPGVATQAAMICLLAGATVAGVVLALVGIGAGAFNMVRWRGHDQTGPKED